jgi:hypothetical protein
MSREDLHAIDLEKRIKYLLYNGMVLVAMETFCIYSAFENSAYSIVHCLFVAQIITQKKLVEIVAAPIESVMLFLPKFAIPIGDIWIVRSNLLWTGRLVFARDFLISLFAESSKNPPCVSRKEFVDVTRLDTQATQELFEGIATLDRLPESGSPQWTLKYPKTIDDNPSFQEFVEGPLKSYAEFRRLGENIVVSDFACQTKL